MTLLGENGVKRRTYLKEKLAERLKDWRVKLEKMSNQDAHECLGEKVIVNQFCPYCPVKSGTRVLA